jgi:hypothetical protein
MGDVWITDLRHFLEPDGDLGPKSGPARSIAAYLASIVGWVTAAGVAGHTRTNVFCRRRPDRRPCEGEIRAGFEDSETIGWECPVCGDRGTIAGWSGTRWDRRIGAREAIREGRNDA